MVWVASDEPEDEAAATLMEIVVVPVPAPFVAVTV